jgi:transaldolase
MIKVPATPAGLPAIEELTRRGININVTLLLRPALLATRY